MKPIENVAIVGFGSLGAMYAACFGAAMGPERLRGRRCGSHRALPCRGRHVQRRAHPGHLPDLRGSGRRAAEPIPSTLFVRREVRRVA